ncbi:2-oxo-4-hydroxy-4-carboxy-5-ureidoimidazoline decarboxylase [Polaromonas sp. YR568]|uniref:2-oxo-4-hydroxy-4-carboxy-5-ureidoimidazoline decarboxylase n=1 Tax=Polaromonas sp. YR568 TaxID=1855301 RepID=UPI0008E6265D|nr:2-oxo-4-hydroxy-4-carboxy-5-ureidoimidazoline decarboxylase [Polaromonas sp. YR568]SFU62796.1 2-oxo-4-hydroxy-4-carboxy-5-ureidoimidazoline decarboxylase [Polaromonas sp. YR568]
MTEAATFALDLDTLNAMDREEFAAALAGTFENSPWVAEAAWAAQPFASLDALHAAMMDAVQSAPRGTQLAFLCGHPELAGKEAQAGTMTRESVGEQASAGLDALSRHEMGELRELNARYRERHGFPFIIAVRRYSKAEIFERLRSRLAQGSELELKEALAQIACITRLRVEARVAA